MPGAEIIVVGGFILLLLGWHVLIVMRIAPPNIDIFTGLEKEKSAIKQRQQRQSSTGHDLSQKSKSQIDHDLDQLEVMKNYTSKAVEQMNEWNEHRRSMSVSRQLELIDSALDNLRKAEELAAEIGAEDELKTAQLRERVERVREDVASKKKKV
jgi:ABC-type multidrug transport system fused ATPase/permease subunit